MFLSNLEHVVIDEIDTLLDCGYELEQFVRQRTYLVGATQTTRVKKFTQEVLGEGVVVLRERNSHMHLENISHEFIQMHQQDKSEPALKLCRDLMKKGSIIVFCNSIQSCRFLDYFLKQNGLPVVSLHGEIPRNVRAENIKRFRDD